MDANILNQRKVFEHYFPPITQDPEFAAFLTLAEGSIKQFFGSRRFKEQYLASATSLADREYRAFQLNNARYELPRCVW